MEENKNNESIRVEKFENTKQTESKKHISAFRVLAVIETIATLSIAVVLFIFTNIWTGLTFLLTGLISMACLFGLADARERIFTLEQEIENIKKGDK